MTDTSKLWLKRRTKALIHDCGGLEEASKACTDGGRRYSTSQLSRCQTVQSPDFLPIDIVLCLEAFCGIPHVTSWMCEARPAAVTAGDLRDELSDVVEGGAALLARYRAAVADGRIDARERDDFNGALDALIEEVRQAQAALNDPALNAMTGGGQ